MYQHPAHQESISREVVLCAQGSRNLFRTARMWILKNSTNLLLSFDFSNLYTSIPQDLLKSCMNNIINNAFKVQIRPIYKLYFFKGSKHGEFKYVIETGI